MPGRFMAMVGALIWRDSDGKYLLLRRASSHEIGQGEWEGVTGRLEQGESFLQALRREVHEEVGLDVRVEFVLRTAHFFRGDESPDNEMVGIYYGCSTEATEILLSEEYTTPTRGLTAKKWTTFFPLPIGLGHLPSAPILCVVSYQRVSKPCTALMRSSSK